jgi:peptidoglycan hydrolase-like protein with peptidoglycan-binding domain
MHKLLIILLIVVFSVFAAVNAEADDLTRMIEENLAALGYDTGEVDGESTTATAIAISQYQAEKGMDVTGEGSPQLAGILAADVKAKSDAATADPAADAQAEASADAEAAASAEAAAEAEALQAAQQACLQEKIAAAEEKKKKKKRFGGLLKTVAKTAGRFGGGDLAKTAGDVYATTATVEDIAETAEALGLTEQDVADCQNPDAA